MDEVFSNALAELDLELVSEMATDDPGAHVTLNKNRVQELTDTYEDEKPEFVVLRVRAGATSRSNNHWPDSILADVAEQVNSDERPGYFGHIKPEDRAYSFPDPQTIWMGATVKQEGGKPTLYVKGYQIPGTKARSHVKSGLVKTASWFGKAGGKVVNGVRMIETFKLESIDWARPGAAGMDAQVVALVSEQEGNGDKVDLSSVTLKDIEDGNPSLFALMKQKVEDEHAEAVSEMETKAQEGEEAQTLLTKITELFGIDKGKDILEKLTEVHQRLDNISTGEIKTKVAELLTKKLPGDAHVKARATILRLLPVSEMEGKTDDEMTELVDTAFEKDDEVMAVVTEMATGPAPLAHRSHERNGDKVGASGMVRESTRKL